MEITDLQQEVLRFRDERDWKQFHTTKNLAASVCIEAAELLQEFQWESGEQRADFSDERRGRIADEIADVAIYLMLLASETGVDIETAISRKLDKNALKYPVEKAKGTSKKYTEL